MNVDIVDVGVGSLPVPTVTGAMVLKLRAWQTRHESRDIEDLVRILELVGDVEEARSALKTGERRDLAALQIRTDAHHRAWRVARDPANALAALDRLAD